MDRRLFLTGMLGFAATAAVATVARPTGALAGVPGGNGILDELEAPTADFLDGDTPAIAEPVNHRPGHHRPRRRRRRRVWRRVCRRYWRHGRRITRCYRTRVWVWVWF